MMLVCKSLQGKLKAYSVLMFCKQISEQNQIHLAYNLLKYSEHKDTK